MHTHNMNFSMYRHYRMFLAGRYVYARLLSDALKRIHIIIPAVKLNEYFYSGIQLYLKKRYLTVLSAAIQTEPEYTEKSELDGSIWICWFQGLDNAPEIVQKCIQSIRRHAGSHRVVIVTEQNMFDLVQLPDYIRDKYKSGTITMQNFSDILRMALLERYGGVWIDATMFAVSALPEEIFNCNFYTIKRRKGAPFYIPGGRWSAYFLAAKKNSPLIHCCLRIFFEYWKENVSLIDYFLVDHTINFCYDSNTICRELIDAVPENNPDIYFFRGKYDKFYDPAEWDRIKKQTVLFKLSWKEYFDNLLPDTWYSTIISR